MIKVVEPAVAAVVKDRKAGRNAVADPLGFLAGRRYTCYCGRSVEGSMLCPACAEDMVRHFLRVARPPRGDR